MRSSGFPLESLGDGVIYGKAGCEKCRKTGYRGRTGIFELLRVTEAIESLIIGRGTTNEIKQSAIAEGMRTLRDDGWEKVLEGITTAEEVLRVTEENE